MALPRVFAAARGLREGHAPPLHAFRQRPATREGRMPARRKTHCRGGFHIRPGRFRRRGVARDDASIVPYRGLLYRGGCGFPVGRGPAVVRRGGIYPLPRALAAARGCPGGMNPAPTSKFHVANQPVGRAPAPNSIPNSSFLIFPSPLHPAEKVLAGNPTGQAVVPGAQGFVGLFEQRADGQVLRAVLLAAAAADALGRKGRFPPQ